MHVPVSQGEKPRTPTRNPGVDSGRKRDGAWMIQGGSRIPKARGLGHPPETPEWVQARSVETGEGRAKESPVRNPGFPARRGKRSVGRKSANETRGEYWQPPSSRSTAVEQREPLNQRRDRKPGPGLRAREGDAYAYVLNSRRY